MVGIAFAVTAAATHAATLQVPEQHATVQAAIDAAQPGDTVLVSPGVYRGPLRIEKSLTLRSLQGAEKTTLDGARACNVIWVNGTGTEQVTITGFKITNAWGPFEGDGLRCGFGGGLVLDAAVVTVSHNIITGNAACYGAGLASNSLSFIHHNRIEGNPQPAECRGAGDGGGIFLNSGLEGRPRWSVISDNLITGHRVAANGGGIEIHGSKVRITGNVIRNNQAGYSGGAINVSRGIVDISRNVIAMNSLTEPGIGGGGINADVIDPMDRAYVIGNVFEGNRADQGSAVRLQGFYAQNIQFTLNDVRGRTAAALVECQILPYVIRHNRMNNPLGGEMSGTCILGDR
ncbi:hypothetical protein ABE85_04605 [Mitsuaria sp. 7]|nr:hypothetical protein ABE85_04605 [Mitsuaria sp. 7]